MSAFPVTIRITRTGEERIVDKLDDLPTGQGFTVLQYTINHDRKSIHHRFATERVTPISDKFRKLDNKSGFGVEETVVV